MTTIQRIRKYGVDDPRVCAELKAESLGFKYNHLSTKIPSFGYYGEEEMVGLFESRLIDWLAEMFNASS